MKGNPAIIKMLNERLAEEHAACVQYKIHARMCANFGYKKLAEYFSKRATDEREHSNELIDRILYLEGALLFDMIAPINVGNDVLDMFPNDLAAETLAVAGYTEGIKLCTEHCDFGTRKLLERILEEEEDHIGEIEAIMTQIKNVGIDNFLSIQIGGNL